MLGSSNRPKLAKLESRKLRELGARRNIKSTAELVQAYNNATETADQTALLHWFQQYVRWFSRQTEFDLTPNIVASYSRLACIRCRGRNDQDLIRQLFRSLTVRLNKSDDCTHDVIPALEYTLNVVDPSIFKNKVKELLQLPSLLLTHLDPEQNRFTKMTYANHALTLFALHQTLVVIQKVAPGQLPEKVLDDLMATMKAIEETAGYYPYIHTARLIKGSIKFLKDHNTLAPWVTLSRRLFHGMCGSLYMVHGIRSIVNIDVNIDAIESGCKHFKQALSGLERDKWTPQLQDLMEVAERSLRDDDFCHIREKMVMIINGGRRWGKEKHGKMIRFSVISQLRMIITEGRSAEIRDEAMEKLLKIACPASSADSWLKEPHLLEAVLDALYTIQKKGNEQSQSAQNTIEELMSIKDEKLRKEVESWKLEIESMEEAFDSNDDQEISECDELFDATRREVGIHLTWDDVQDSTNKLRERYKSLRFVEVPSLFNEWSPRHVKTFEYDIVRYEEVPVVKGEGNKQENHLHEFVESKKRICKQVSLENIMKPKECQEGTIPTIKDRKFLLLGNPGTGKTSLVKSFAYGWASGNMASNFDTVYVLRLRNITTPSLMTCPRKKKDLTAAIAVECLAQEDHSDDEYEALLKKIKDDLAETNTLLIIDGVDEGDGTGSVIVQQAMKQNCHVLLTSRPYNLSGIRREVGIEMECTGLNDEQLRRYIGQEVKERADHLVEHLRQTSMWEIAHVPITVGILCCVWNEKNETHASNKIMPKNRLFLYDQMVNFVWERYVRKLDESTPVHDRDKVFGALKKIAFHSRNEGKILISELLVRNFSPDGKTGGALQNSGFILLEFEGRQYQFAHLTFQEYYAALFLEENLSREGHIDNKIALTFIAQNKYKVIHRDTLYFMMQKMAVMWGEEALDKILHIVDQEPRDVLGVQHTLLKLQMVDAFLSVKEDALGDNCYVTCKKIVDAASKIFYNFRCHEEHFRWVEHHAKQSSTVSKRFPELFVPFVERNIRWSEDTRKELFERLPTLGRICPGVLRLFEEFLSPSMAENEEDRKRILEKSAGFPVNPSDVEISIADILSKAYRDSSPGVRTAACLTLGRFIRSSPLSVSDVKIAIVKRFHSLSSILLSDEDSYVRKDPLDEIRCCVEQDYDLAMFLWSLIFQTSGNADEQNVLDKGFDDENKYVRSYAMEAFIAFAVQLQDQATYPREKISIGCCDPEYIVRSSIVERLKILAPSGEENAKLAWRLLLQFLEDKSASIRKEAMKQAAKIVQATSIDEVSVRKQLIVRLTEDEDGDVRIEALRTMNKLVTDDMDDSEGLVDILARVCDDKDVTIRKEACDLLACIGKKASTLRETCLNVLETKCEDEEKEVRDIVYRHLLDLSTHHCPEKGEEAVHQEQELVTTEEKRLEDFKSLLETYIKDNVSLEEIEKSAGAVQNSDELMTEVASSALEKSDYSSRNGGLQLLECVIERIRKSGKVPNCAMQVTKLAIKAQSQKDTSLAIIRQQSSFPLLKYHERQIIESLPLKWLLDYYLSSHDDETATHIAERVLDIAVTVTHTSSSDQTNLVIHEASNEIEYTRSFEEIDHLVSMVKSVLPDGQPAQQS